MAIKTEMEKANGILSGGGTILYPTDTIWGIGCDATDRKAVEKIYGIKNRKDTKAMLVLVDSAGMLEDYVEEVPEMALEIIDISNRPLTIIYPGARGLADNLVHSDGSIGIRITTDPFCTELLRAFGKPIVSTSANVTGKTAPAFFNQIEKSIIGSVDYVVEWRRDDNEIRKPSGILKVALNGEIEVIRK